MRSGGAALLLAWLLALAPACGSPTTPDNGGGGAADVRIIVLPAGTGSDATARQWAVGWSVFFDAGTPLSGAPAGPGTVVRTLPMPVAVAEVSSAISAPDGQRLTTVTTSALDISLMNLIAVNQGTNQVTTTRGIIVNQHALYTSTPSATAQAAIVVRLIDGRGDTHTVTVTNEIRQERAVPGPCTTRDQPSGRIDIRASGATPKETHPVLGICFVFVNDDTVAHDIRSDAHPAHADCPEWNLGVIAPGGSRTSLRVTTWGTCGYHDELGPTDERFQGRFIVDPPS